jgi:N-acetylglucosamine-6-sulfatase
MRRLVVLVIPLAVIVLAGSTALASEGAPAQQSRPNVVVVMSDDQAIESMRVMSNVQQQIGAQGATFANNFASFPLCCPSRATFITGQYGHHNTIMGNAPPQGGYEKLRPTESNSLPAWLQQAGYFTVHVGKYLNGYGRQTPTHVPAGWSEWYGSIDPTTYRFYNYTLNENGRLVNYGSAESDYQADVYTRKAVDLVRRLAPASQPFFLSVAYLAPHAGQPREPGDPANQATPVPAPRHRDRYASEPLPTMPSFNEADVSDKPQAVRRRPMMNQRRIVAVTENYRQRLESVLAIDEGVAAIVAALQASGELDNTLFVYTSDNGFFHGEHRIPNGKVQVYEPSVRVPLVLRGPGIPRGVRLTHQAINVDLAPTILDAANARPGRVVDGASLLPLAGDPGRFLGRDVLLETPTYSGLHTPRYKYVEYTNGDRELYDLARDPDELQSLHADPRLAAVRAELARRLAAMRSCRGVSCRIGPRLLVRASCAKSKRRVSLVGSDTRWTLGVQFLLRGRLVARDSRRPFLRTISGGRGALRVRAFLSDGRVVTYDRTVRACG